MERRASIRRKKKEEKLLLKQMQANRDVVQSVNKKAQENKFEMLSTNHLIVQQIKTE